MRPCAARSDSTLLPTPIPPDVRNARSAVITRMTDVSGVPVESIATRCPRTLATCARSGAPSLTTIAVSATAHRDASSPMRAPRITGPMPIESMTSDASAASQRIARREARAAVAALAAAPPSRPGLSGAQAAIAIATATAIRAVVNRRSPSTRSRRAPRARGRSPRTHCARACSSGNRSHRRRSYGPTPACRPS